MFSNDDINKLYCLINSNSYMTRSLSEGKKINEQIQYFYQ